MRVPRWNSPWVISLMVTLAYEVAGDLIGGWIRESAGDVIANVVASPLSSVAVLAIAFGVTWWAQSTMDGRRSPAESEDGLGGAIRPSGELGIRVIKADSDEAKWKRAALTFVTWLYRRDEWSGLTQEARVAEAAPEEYASKRLTHLGLGDLQYERRPDVGPDPWWTPPEHILVSSGGTRATCSCGWSGEGHRFAEHAGGPPATPTWRPMPAQAKAAPSPAEAKSQSVPPALAGVPDAGREPFLAEMRGTFESIEGDLKKQHRAIWRLTLAEASIGRNQRQVEGVTKTVLDRADQYAVTYWLDGGLLARADQAAKDAGDPEPPGPAWRVILTRRVGYVQEWMKEHAVPSADAS